MMFFFGSLCSDQNRTEREQYTGVTSAAQFHLIAAAHRQSNQQRQPNFGDILATNKKVDLKGVHAQKIVVVPNIYQVGTVYIP